MGLHSDAVCCLEAVVAHHMVQEVCPDACVVLDTVTLVVRDLQHSREADVEGMPDYQHQRGFDGLWLARSS